MKSTRGRFAATSAAVRRGRALSPRTVRGLIAAVVLGLMAALGYTWWVLYGKQAAVVPASKPRMGQWAVMQEEEVVVPPSENAQARLRAGQPQGAPPPAAAPGEEAAEAAAPAVVTTRVPRRKRTIVLSTGEGRWNTGVWPNWGQSSSEVVLNWAAAGVVVKKHCPTECIITHDQSALASADAVIMEVVNHPKFLGPAGDQVPIPWPTPRRPNPKLQLPGPRPTAIPEQLPLTANFYFEAAQSYPKYTMANPELTAKFDFTMTPDQTSTLPVTLICPWGRDAGTFARTADDVMRQKAPGRLIGYFNEHGVAPSYSGVVNELFQLAGTKLHAFQQRANAQVPEEFNKQPFQLTNRIDFMGTYKFLLVTEAIEEKDWIEPEFSQALLSGAVPVYIGAPNALDYIPGARSIIHIRDFPSVKELWDYILSFDDEGERGEEGYREFHAWRAAAQETFMRDEMGSNPQLGTGQGVSRHQGPREQRVSELLKWSARPATGGKGGVPSLADLTKGPNRVGEESEFFAASVAAWQSFRVALDHCVHYAECRICELVTLLT